MSRSNFYKKKFHLWAKSLIKKYKPKVESQHQFLKKKKKKKKIPFVSHNTFINTFFFIVVQIFGHFMDNSETSSLSHCTYCPILHICKKWASGKTGSDGHNCENSFGLVWLWMTFQVQIYLKKGLIWEGWLLILMGLNVHPPTFFMLEAQWICWGKAHAILFL